jgi:dipeptidyl aminopeptidase/acylaminoacyl peptidase
MNTFDLLPDLAARLERLLPPEAGPGDWSDVLRRVAPVRRFSRTRPAQRLAVLVVALLLLLGAVATATYLVLHRGAAKRPHSGALTVTAGGYNARWPVKIIEVLPRGRTVVVWRCPVRVFCGEPEGLDWSSDGRHVAFTVDEFNAAKDAPYLGLHILNIETGRDIRLLGEHQSRSDCPFPAAVAWSPDGRTLAYDCAAFEERSRIWLVATDGSHRRRLPTGSLDAAWPTWSPDGTHLAFAASRSGIRNGIYTVRLDGTALRRVVRHGSAPDWSPDGREIAYRAQSGVRLVTPTGRNVTPSRRGGVGPAGAPAWSPDGRELAIAGISGLYLVDRTGQHLRRVSIRADVGSIGPRPAWYPVTRTTSSSPSAPSCQPC